MCSSKALNLTKSETDTKFYAATNCFVLGQFAPADCKAVVK